MNSHQVKNIIGVVSLFTAVSIFIFAFFSFGPGAGNNDETTTTTNVTTTCRCCTTTTEVTTTTPAPVVIEISVAALMAQFAGTTQEVVQQIAPLDGADRVQSRTFTGVAIRDIFTWQGVELYSNASATLNVGGSVLQPAVFLAESTLLAWHEVNHDNDDAATDLANARLIFGDEQGLRWGAYRQNIVEITLEF
ncbi:MAG: hypothetical protein FWE40_04660 [Oscillospiraceae bacterium]|nr:hypothetical protein [Oscillospiraceae bacterium]